MNLGSRMGNCDSVLRRVVAPSRETGFERSLFVTDDLLGIIHPVRETEDQQDRSTGLMLAALRETP